MKPFIITLFAAAALLSGAVVGLERARVIPDEPTFFIEIVIFLTVTTAFLFRLVVRAAADNFMQAFFLSMVVKFVAYGAFLFFVIRQDQQNAIPNTVLFLTGYLLFTAIEIFYLYRRSQA